eukprot:TRINITY_DN7761_c0_g1_i1.p2 TRINITY_DN7761_c0_g1~~TRINITY_DN7761_c0_g1_i1.p2  ORF type:complete len:116 (+),score=3.81 TRINITY_DN7761_c0_g1_i1:96-443(+)
MGLSVVQSQFRALLNTVEGVRRRLREEEDARSRPRPSPAHVAQCCTRSIVPSELRYQCLLCHSIWCRDCVGHQLPQFGLTGGGLGIVCDGLRPLTAFADGPAPLLPPPPNSRSRA